jgi:MoaA/NifB/PqqE/SkfB family radical SAM enzyme
VGAGRLGKGAGVQKTDIFLGWARILQGYRPLLSIEITKECPLRCPGCYAYEAGHLGGLRTLRGLADLKGDSLVDGVMALVRRHRPIHVSIVGGEPLVRYRELDALLPKLDRMGIEVQLVTSAVRAIPAHWADIGCLHLVISVDGLPQEHDRKRSPATYERVLQNIRGHKVIVHCTITRQLLQRPGYLHEFAQFWSDRLEARKIWFSLFTPQKGGDCEERLTSTDRAHAIDELTGLVARFRKVDMPRAALQGFGRPPASPADCMFAQLSTCYSADLNTEISPCQFGGEPSCAECGCLASAGLASLGRYKLGGMVPVSGLYFLSKRVGEGFRRHLGLLARPPIDPAGCRAE